MNCFMECQNGPDGIEVVVLVTLRTGCRQSKPHLLGAVLLEKTKKQVGM
jgi:hypothetical protein